MRGKTITHEEYINYIKDINPNIEIISKFQAMCESIECRCLIDGYEWTTEARNPYRGHGCPKCAHRKRGLSYRTDNKAFVDRLKIVNPYVEPIDEYITSLIPIKCKCLICGEYFLGIPRNLLQGRIHIECARINSGNKTRKSHNQFLKEMILANPNIEVLGQYKGADKKINCRCRVCGHEWSPFANHIVKLGVGCPKCSESKGEKRIATYMNNNNIQYISQYTYGDLIGINGGLLRFDFMVHYNNHNFLIEYQGHFHDGNLLIKEIQTKEELSYQQEHDRRKREYAAQHDIDLLEIWYWDYENIETILNEKLKIAS
jgi:hypothetical protein